MTGAKEIPGAKDKLNKLYREGHVITFFTSRSEELRAVTEIWLNEHGFFFHGLICGKPRGGNYHYIDDKDIKATKFRGWE